MTRLYRTGLRASLALATAAALAAWLPPGSVPEARAQEGASRPSTAQAAGDGWLGVGLISFRDCLEGPGAPEDECRHTLVVGGLVHGSPAERAGLQPGDTLLAVGESRLAEGTRDAAFRRLSPGDTVSLLVGRPDGRVRLEAVPGTRPDSLAIVQYHRDGPYVEDRARYLLAIPDRTVLDSLVARAVRDPNVRVRTRVSVVPADRVKKIPLRTGPRGLAPPSPPPEEIAEIRKRARELRRRAVEQAREIREEVNAAARENQLEARREAAEEWKRWVAEELQPRLQVIYDSVLAEARHRMDSLKALHPAAAAAARAAARAADSLSVQPPRPPRAERPEMPEEAGGWNMPANRIAGAEVQPLSPELADFFAGVERGVVVLQVLPGTPAHRLGLRPGDVIVEAAGHPVTAVEGLRHALMEHGGATEIRWVRRGRAMADTLRH